MADTNDVLHQIEEINTEFKVAYDQMIAASKNAFKNAFKKYFELYPFIGAVAFTAYTPYFADGDPLEYSVGEVVIYSVKDMEEVKTGEQNLSFWENGAEVYKNAGHSWASQVKDGEDPEWKSAQQVAAKVIYGIPEDAFKAMFGDHKAITVKPEGVEVDDWDHE